MIRVSVIVPVYNVYEYLDKCLKSLVNQTLKDIEIIVVNDGSTDNSQEIIDEYVSKYDFVKSYIKTNGGLSDARNYGMRYATGKYIGFIDSDDYVDIDMYEKMYNKAEEDKSDIVECDLHHTYHDYEDDEIGARIYDKKELIMNGRSVVWNKIYRRELLEKAGIEFLKGIIYEDVNFFVKLMPHVNKYSYVDNVFVHYVQRKSSINNMYSKKTLDIIYVIEDIITYYKEKNLYDEYKDTLEYLTIRLILCSSFLRMSKIPDKKNRLEAYYLNWSTLVKEFPNWKENKYLRDNKTKRGIYMKSVNKFSYNLYGKIFALYSGYKRKNNKQWS